MNPGGRYTAAQWLDIETLRAIRAENRCTEAQCVDQFDENCVCHAQFIAVKAAEEAAHHPAPPESA